MVCAGLVNETTSGLKLMHGASLTLLLPMYTDEGVGEFWQKEQRTTACFMSWCGIVLRMLRIHYEVFQLCIIIPVHWGMWRDITSTAVWCNSNDIRLLFAHLQMFELDLFRFSLHSNKFQRTYPLPCERSYMRLVVEIIIGDFRGFLTRHICGLLSLWQDIVRFLDYTDEILFIIPFTVHCSAVAYTFALYWKRIGSIYKGRQQVDLCNGREMLPLCNFSARFQSIPEALPDLTVVTGPEFNSIVTNKLIVELERRRGGGKSDLSRGVIYKDAKRTWQWGSTRICLHCWLGRTLRRNISIRGGGRFCDTPHE